MSISPGWYPDPQNGAVHRWWDGQTWTAHTKPATGAHHQPPMSAGMPPQFFGGAPAASPPHGSPPPGLFPVGPTQPSAWQPIAVPPPPSQPHSSGTPGLNGQIHATETRLAELRRELESVEEAIEMQAFGVYRPRYGFQTSDEYDVRLKQVREQQKQMIKSGAATFCDTEWKIAGSAAEGKKMVERMSKLMLRAF